MSLPTKSKQWILANKPTAFPVLKGNESTFALETKNIQALQDGEVLLQTLYLSNDPAQRHLHIFPHPTTFSPFFDLLTNTKNQDLDIHQRWPWKILHSSGTNWWNHARTWDLQSARFKSRRNSKRFYCRSYMRLVWVRNLSSHYVPIASRDSWHFDHSLSGSFGSDRVDSVLRICKWLGKIVIS